MVWLAGRFANRPYVLAGGFIDGRVRVLVVWLVGQVWNLRHGVFGQRPERVRDRGICAALPVVLPFGMDGRCVRWVPAYAGMTGVLRE